MSAQTFPACPHPRETWRKENNVSSYRCDECNAKVCLDCHRYGEKDFMIPLVSWMTGVCDDCYRQREERRQVRKDFDDSRSRRERLRDAWDAGRAAGPDDTNPHAEPSEYSDECWLLGKHDWLREEVQS